MISPLPMISGAGTLELVNRSGQALEVSLTLRCGFQSDELEADGSPTTVERFVVAYQSIQDYGRLPGTRSESAAVGSARLNAIGIGHSDLHATGGHILELAVVHGAGLNRRAG